MIPFSSTSVRSTSAASSEYSTRSVSVPGFRPPSKAVLSRDLRLVGSGNTQRGAPVRTLGRPDLTALARAALGYRRHSEQRCGGS